MPMVKLFIIPLVAALISTYLWYATYITGKTAFLFGVIVNLIYLLIQLYRYGLLFTSTTISEIDWPSFTYYYKEYECEYKDIRKKAFKELSESDRNMLKSQPMVNYMEIYQDCVAPGKALESGHACGGFALRSGAETDIGISKVLETHGFKRRVFEKCRVALSTMKKVDELSGRIALDKTADQIWTHLKAGRISKGVLFIWEEKKTVSCGAFMGEESRQYIIKGFINEANVKSEMILNEDRIKKLS